jgi:hypothetical protein
MAHIWLIILIRDKTNIRGLALARRRSVRDTIQTPHTTALILAIIGAAAAIVAPAVPVVLSWLHPGTAGTPSEIALQEIEIETPIADAEVGNEGMVTGFSSYQDVSHWILITSLSTQVRVVASDPFRPMAHQRYNVLTRYGSGKEGLGEEFLVEVIATRAPLKQGEHIATLPADAVLSKAVSVRRTH